MVAAGQAASNRDERLAVAATTSSGARWDPARQPEYSQFSTSVSVPTTGTDHPGPEHRAGGRRGAPRPRGVRRPSRAV